MAEGHDTLALEILTPNKPFLTKSVTLVVVPSQEGDCGIMAGMAPLVCALRAGVVCLFDEKLEPVERYFVPSGTAWVTRERAVLLLPEITPLERIDRHALKEEIRRVEAQDLQDSQTLSRLEVLQQQRYATDNIPYS